MDLLTYIKELDKDALAALAGRCRTSVGQIRQVAYGNRRAGAELAVNIDRESQGSVRCDDLRPDIDWAYVRSTALLDSENNPSGSCCKAA